MAQHKTMSYLYCLFDKVTGNCLYYSESENDGSYVRKLIQCTTIPFTQSVPLCLGSVFRSVKQFDPSNVTDFNWFDTVKYEFYKTPRQVDWSSCKLPENQADAIAPLGLSPDEVIEITRRAQSNIVSTR